MKYSLFNSSISIWSESYAGPRFHGVLCDPPYELGFMGKSWDSTGVAFQKETWEMVLNCLHPGAYLLAFGGTRTFHRLACAIEDAGFEIRDTLMWVYGSGFPKSLDVSKAIDKANGAEREVIGQIIRGDVEAAKRNGNTMAAADANRNNKAIFGYGIENVTVPATDAAKQWDGYGTALKPAWEPIILARKPIEGTVAANVLKYGCGAINIDGCRVGADVRTYDLKGGENLNKISRPNGNDLLDAKGCGAYGVGAKQIKVGTSTVTGRWPANLVHDGSQMVLELFPNTGISRGGNSQHINGKSCFGDYAKENDGLDPGYGDSGSAARFFYCAKASKAERGEGNNHPTVKPIALCQYLAKLILPPTPESKLLVPFSGSGSECIGALLAGWSSATGIDLDPDYIKIATDRIRRWIP